MGELFDLTGKVAVITGSSRGIGKAIATRLAEDGHDLVVSDLPSMAETLEQTRAELEGLGVQAVALTGDVSDAESVRGLVQGTAETLGSLDVMVANAGIASYGRAWELDETTWQDMIDVNLTGVWHTAKAAIPQLIEAGGGAMVFTSSIGGFKGIQQVGHYVSAKHGVVGLMRNLANELAPHRVRVNTVHPTNVDTHMIQNPGTWGMFAPGDPEPTQEKAIPGFTSLNALEIPWIESVDVANAVLFLLSDEARYITGATLPVDAGAAIK